MNLWSDWRHDDDDLISKQWTCQVNSYMLITWGYQDTIKEVPSQWFVCQFGIRSKQEAVISGKGFPLRSSGPGADSTPWITWVLFSCIAYDYRILFLNKLLLKLVHGLDMLDQYHHQIPPQCATYGVKKKLCCCCNWNLHSRRPDVDDGRPAVKKSSILFFGEGWHVDCSVYGLMHPKSLLWSEKIFVQDAGTFSTSIYMKFSHFGENLEKLAENVALLG